MRCKVIIAKLFVLMSLALLAATAAKAGVSAVTITSTIAAQSNAAVSTSGSVVTIDSDQLTNATGNPIAFDMTALTTNAVNFDIDGFSISTTSPNGFGATSTTPINDILGGGDRRRTVYTLPVDQVASGGSTVSFTITLTSFTDFDGFDTIASCTAANSDSLNDCDETTITVNVTPATADVNTSEITNNFVRRRARNILNSDPELGDQLGGGDDDGEVGAVTYKASGSLEKYNIGFAANTGSSLKGQGYNAQGSSANPYNFWIDGNISRSKEAGQSQDFAVTHFGIGYRASEDHIYGLMAQIDYAKEVNGTASVRGTGWLIGPYLAARLRDNLIFDGRVAYGQSDNKVSPLGTYTDQFETTRFLIRGQVTGDYQHNEWTIAPNLGFSYIHEEQEAYTDSLSVAIPEAVVELGQITFGTDFKTEIIQDNGMIFTPSFGIKGLWNFKDTGFLDAATSTVRTDLIGDLSARIDLGLKIADGDLTSGGRTFDVKAFYDGIGASNYEAYGASVKYVVKF